MHLVKNASMLKNVVNCDQSCRAANNTMERVIKMGSVELSTIVDDKEVIVYLPEIY